MLTHFRWSKTHKRITRKNKVYRLWYRHRSYKCLLLLYPKFTNTRASYKCYWSFFSLIIVIWCYHILTFNSFKVLAVTLSRAMPSAHKQIGCILHCSGSNSRCSGSRILDSDTKWKFRAPWLPLVWWCTPAKHTSISIPLPTEWSIRQIGIKKHPLTALLKYSPAVLKISILSCWQALRLDLSRHACCRRRPIHNAHQTHSHSSIQSMLVFGPKKA